MFCRVTPARGLWCCASATARQPATTRRYQTRPASKLLGNLLSKMPPSQTLPARPQVDRLMDMIVNSLYSNRDVFLRELVSNASDALDKIRFLGLSDSKALEAGTDLEIRIRSDPDAKTITIE